MTTRLRLDLFTTAPLLLSLLSSACSESVSTAAALAAGTQAPTTRPGVEAAAQGAASAAVTDAPLAAWQAALLDLAFDAASALPVEPHVKTRSRNQELVADACLELALPRRALDYTGRIADWRRGAGYAAYAVWCAERGLNDDVQASLDRAARVADSDPTALGQDWRRDRIRARLAQACLWLGDDERAVALQQGLVDAETGPVGAAMAGLVPRDEVDARVAELDALVATGTLDLARNVLATYARLFDRFYDDAELRDRLQQRTLEALGKLPLQVRMELALDLARSALAHGDHLRAAELTEEARRIRDSAAWLPEDMSAWMGRLAAMRLRLGDEAGARAEIDVALAWYDEHRERIVDIWRAGALRPVAEAVALTGDAAAARALYARALDEGLLNPNSVPRAEDLVATCLSLVRSGVEPDDGLWDRLHAVRDALGAPW